MLSGVSDCFIFKDNDNISNGPSVIMNLFSEQNHTSLNIFASKKEG